VVVGQAKSGGKGTTRIKRMSGTEFHKGTSSLMGRESGWWTVFALVGSLGGRGGPAALWEMGPSLA
jgi:hypothetical protein